MSGIRRGAKALLVAALAAPVLAVGIGAPPANAVDVGKGEFSIEGKGAFSTSNAKLGIGQPTNAKNSGATRTDLDWVVVPFTILDGRTDPDSNFVISAAEGSTLQVLAGGDWYESAVGFRFRPGAPGMRFDGCETERGRFRVDEYVQDPITFVITKFRVRFESHCNGTVIGSVSWNGTGASYQAHRAEGNVTAGGIDYGVVTAGAPVDRTVTIHNTGDATLSVNPGGQAVAKLEGFGAEDFTLQTNGCSAQSLAANGSCNITVRANPKADGPSDATLRVFSEFTGTDGGHPIGGGEAIHLRLTGTGSGAGRVDMDGEAGNAVSNGARTVKTGAFAGSGGTVSLTGTGLSLTLSGPTFTKGGSYAIGGGVTMGLTVNGAPCTSPSGSLTVVQLGGNISNFVARFKVTCSNSSLAGSAVVGQIVFSPTDLVVSRVIEPASSVVFGGTVPVGQASLPSPITVTNDGRADTAVKARIIGDVAQFSIVINTCKDVVLAPGKSCTILVAFSPQRAGVAQAAIAVRDTFSNGLDRRVFLQGTGSDSPGYVWDVDGEFVPLPPARILDTRTDPAISTVPEPLRGGQPRFFDVVGKGGVPTQNASAVVLNVTVDRPATSAYLTVYPTTASNTPPTASNLNFVAGQTVPNLVVVPIGDGGRVSLYTNAGQVEVIVDVVGWITSLATTQRGSRLEPLTPTRILDTRNGTGGRSTPLGGNEVMKLQVAEPGDGYTAAVINLTGVEATAATYVTAYPTGLPTRPTASNLNLVRTQVRPNLVMVQLGSDGAIDLYNFAGEVNLVADLVGLYKPGGLRESQAGRIKPINPTRVIDTRANGPGGRLAGGTTQTWNIGTQAAAAGLANMGAGENGGFIGNFTATEGTAETFLTAYPSDKPRPTASNLNVLPNENVPNLSVVTLSGANTFDVYNHAGLTHYIFDVVARIASDPGRSAS